LADNQRWIKEVKNEYNCDINENGMKKRICIFLRNKWSNKIKDSSYFMKNKILWYQLTNIPSENIRFIKVYAPNDPKERSILWNENFHNLPQDCKCGFSKDFNMVEVHASKSSTCSRPSPNGCYGRKSKKLFFLKIFFGKIKA
jgi:hypothetical protein